MTQNPITGDAPDTSAAELALGLLDGPERAQALRRVLSERGFAQSVDRWRDHVAQLFDFWPAMPAPDGVLARVERSIDGPQVIQSHAMPARFWRAAAAFSGLIAATLLIVVLLRPSLPEHRPPIAGTAAAVLVASIEPVAGGSPVAAIYNPATGVLRIPESVAVAAGQSAELSVMERGLRRPLGPLAPGGGTSLSLADADRARLAGGAELVISIEPSGRIIARGALAPV